MVFDPEDGSDTFLRNAVLHMDYTLLYPRKGVTFFVEVIFAESKILTGDPGGESIAFCLLAVFNGLFVRCSLYRYMFVHTKLLDLNPRANYTY
jgi:hypothetical protein